VSEVIDPQLVVCAAHHQGPCGVHELQTEHRVVDVQCGDEGSPSLQSPAARSSSGADVPHLIIRAKQVQLTQYK
jgi:hypothetical protein